MGREEGAIERGQSLIFRLVPMIIGCTSYDYFSYSSGVKV